MLKHLSVLACVALLVTWVLLEAPPLQRTETQGSGTTEERAPAQIDCAAPGALARTANCAPAIENLTDAGGYTGSASPGGSFDPRENVDEWKAASSDSPRRVQGGSFRDSREELAAPKAGNPALGQVDFQRSPAISYTRGRVRGESSTHSPDERGVSKRRNTRVTEVDPGPDEAIPDSPDELALLPAADTPVQEDDPGGIGAAKRVAAPEDYGIESIPGTLPLDHQLGDYVTGADGSGDWSGVGYGSETPSGIYLAAANQLADALVGAPRDGSWVSESGNQGGAWDGNGIIWDLSLRSEFVDVFPFTDEAGAAAGVFLSATGFRVWGSNDLSTWEEADLDTVWEQGHRADAVYDDYTSGWSWPSAYRYVGIVAGNPQTGTLAPEAKIDAVAAPLNLVPVNDFELDVSTNVPYNLFGSVTSAISNTQSIEIPVDAANALLGRTDPFQMVLSLSGGLLAAPLPKVGPSGSGADVELGTAFGAETASEWTIEHTGGDVGGTELFFTVSPEPASLPVAEGTAFRLASQSIRVEALDTWLAEPGRGLRLNIEYEQVLSRLPLDYFGTVKVVQTVPGVQTQGSHSVTDVGGNAGPVGRLFYASNPIRVTPEAACSGFPDGNGLFPSRNCDASDNFQLDVQEDRIRMVVEGTGLGDFLGQPGSGISVHRDGICDPSTELAFTDEMIPVAYSTQALLDFPVQDALETEFIVCLESGDLTMLPPQEIGIASYVDFGSILLLPSEVATARLSIIPRCFGDLNGDYRVNNADALLLRGCFPCSGPDCDHLCDYNFDGLVNNTDVLAFRSNFGATCEEPPDSSYPYLAGHLMLFGAPAPAIVMASVSVTSLLILLQLLPARLRRR